MRWQDKLTKKELKHVRKYVGNTLTAFKTQAKEVTEDRNLGNGFTGPCGVCKSVAKKLGLRV